MNLSDFSYDLPDEYIARYPLPERSASRLLCLDGNGHILHKTFPDIVSLLNPNDLLVCNNTRVIPARLFGHKESGGKVEVLVERILDEQRILAHVRAGKAPRSGSVIHLEKFQLIMVKRHDNLFEFHCSAPALEILEKIGHIPLPPYLQRSAEESDKERYQTIFAAHKGSVAAPTAGLHFDAAIMQQLQEKGIEIAYVTLHVGAGTFAPVRVDDIKNHRMHSETMEVSAELCEKIRETKMNNGRVIAVGTTSARCLETASLSGEIKPFKGDTDIFIYPGFQFHCIDALITNFHLPGSTLLMLVSAFAGYQQVMEAYRQAVIHRYRFFSYGDAMFITP